MIINPSCTASLLLPFCSRLLVYCYMCKDSWLSLVRIVEWYGDHQHELIPVAGPGHWNDPDQVR